MMRGIGGSNAQEQLAELKPWANPAPRITGAERLERVARARALMSSAGVDALLINAGTSLRYFTGLPWTPSERLVAMVLLRSGSPVMVAPAFEAGSLIAGLGVEAELRTWQEHENPYQLVADLLSENQTKLAALDPMAPYFIAEGLRKAGVGTVDAAPIVNGCRMTKSAAELALMTQAKTMTLDVQRRAARILSPGITSGEVKRFIDEAHRRLGADGGSTFCAVQFAKATAYPHGLPGEQALQRDDLVLIDTGCTVDGYHSDITRTYVFGTPTAEYERMWQLEQEAQQAAFDAVRPGVPCEDIDAAARRVLERAGLGPGYRLPGLPHRTGHGIGLAIHEPAYLVRGDRTPLAPGMCFSNEPMIVVPDRFGIRLEDHFYVTDTGAEWFTERQYSISSPFG